MISANSFRQEVSSSDPNIVGTSKAVTTAAAAVGAWDAQSGYHLLIIQNRT